MNLSSHASRNRLFAGLVFLYSFIIYLLTLAPTASFWDSGEFIAVAHGLQVTHPPGAPLYLLIGRLFSMFAPVEWISWSVNLLSAVASALTVMLLYLIIVRLVREWLPKDTSSWSMGDAISTYGGAIIGATTFAVTDSFWFNAVEAEVYALSMFFTAIAVWLALKWSEDHDKPGNERWIVLIAYMFGLALGVHLLNLLVIFFVALIIYFKKYDFNIISFSVAAALASASFLLIYPFTMKSIAGISMSVSEATFGLISPVVFFMLVGLLVIAGIAYTHLTKRKLANIFLMSYFMILVGFSSYSLVIIRSIADPPVDENDPETIEAFIKYINRDQYGDTPILSGFSYSNEIGGLDRSKEKLFPRRHSSDPRHQKLYSEYSGDWSYFWSYQVNHMYIRYFNWQFIGRESDIQDTGTATGFRPSEYADNHAHNVYYFLPFLLGLFGMFYHFQKDWKRAFSVLALFLMTGFFILIYLNQTPYQPRERDYSYVGSFFAYAIWIGIGATALLDWLRHLKKDHSLVLYASLTVLFAAVPAWMLYQNYHDHDRSGNYAAPDYAYNLLQSVAPYGILFTNGDNDTFPLWYAQEVEGVRTDVRVANLSLLNTDWYIKQLKNQWSHESPPIKFSVNDEQISRLEQKFSSQRMEDWWTPQTVVIPVDKNLLRGLKSQPENMSQWFSLDSKSPLNPQAALPTYQEMAFDIPVDSLDDQVSWFFQGNFLTRFQDQEIYYTRIQDDMVMDILKSNDWLRPVYFAVTVSRDGQIGLQNYFRTEGQAYRVVPKLGQGPTVSLNPITHGQRLRTFRFRNLDNPNVYYDENVRRMTENYRELITNQAMAWFRLNEPDSAQYWLKWGETKIPFDVIESDISSTIRYAYRYAQVGSTEEAIRLAERSLPKAERSLRKAMLNFNGYADRIDKLRQQANDARAKGDVTKARSLTAQSEIMINNIESYRRELYFNAGNFALLQNIFFKSGNASRADEIRLIAETISEGMIPLPKTQLESDEQVRSMYGE
jgi:MFS family permease